MTDSLFDAVRQGGINARTKRDLFPGLSAKLVERSVAGLQPCTDCGYMIRGGTLCGDCREYGPPRGWRWEYDPATGKHNRVES